MILAGIFNEISNYLVSLILPLVVGAVLTVGVYLSVTYVLEKSERVTEFKRSVKIIVREPVPILILGIAVFYADSFNGSLFPAYITSSNLIFIIELVLLAVSINASRKISNILVIDFLKAGNKRRRFLLLGVYSAGLIALFYIIITSPVSPALAASGRQMISFVSGIIATYIIAYVINLVISRYQLTLKEKQPQLNTTITFARRVIMGVAVLVGAAASGFAAFPAASGAIASLFVAAGFTSIVLGLAAQSSLSNLIAGGVVATSQPFKIGDTISYDGNYCTVEDIKLMTTTLKIWDGRRQVVPNKMFLDTSVINYSSVDPSMYMMLYIQITPDSNIDKAIEIMTKAAKEHPSRVPMEGLPVTAILGFTESGVNMRVLSYAADQNTAYQMQRDLRYVIKKEFEKYGIKLAFPRRDVHVHGVDENTRAQYFENTGGDKPMQSDNHGQNQ